MTGLSRKQYQAIFKNKILHKCFKYGLHNTGMSSFKISEFFFVLVTLVSYKVFTKIKCESWLSIHNKGHQHKSADTSCIQRDHLKTSLMKHFSSATQTEQGQCQLRRYVTCAYYINSELTPAHLASFSAVTFLNSLYFCAGRYFLHLKNYLVHPENHSN